MAKVTGQTNSVIVNEREYPKNTLSFTIVDATKVSIERASDGSIVQGPIPYSEYKDGSNVPYTTQANLVTALRTALFGVLS